MQRSRAVLLAIQRHLYHVMTELAASAEVVARFYQTTADDVTNLEQLTDELAAELQLPKEFIVPGDTLPGAALDLARTVTRRAERIVARMVHQGEFDNQQVLRYLNRLSSLLFIMARYEDAASGATSVTLAKHTTP